MPYTWYTSPGFAPFAYLDSSERELHAGVVLPAGVGRSLRTVVVIEPSTALFFPPSEASTMMFEVPETPLTITFGRHPRRFAKT